MKLPFLVCWLALGALAQPSLTTIQDTVYDQFGDAYSGNLTISLSAKSGSSVGSPVISVVKSVPITGGNLNVKLAPNDTLTPSGTSYIFAFANGAKKTCTFPTTSSAITLAPYCTDNPPTNPTPNIPLTWLNPSGFTIGQVIGMTSGGFGPVNAGAGGGGLSATATFAQMRAGTAGSGVVGPTTTFAQMRGM